MDYDFYKTIREDLEELKKLKNFKSEIESLVNANKKFDYIMVADLEDLIFKYTKPLGKIKH